jgi:putative ubiquitin-RnfH superfamily antitoxin RatB of RatAB toxin-antitoxin module
MDFSSGSAMLDTDTEALPAEPQTGFTISENNWTLTANYMDDALENAAISALGQSVNFMENKVGTLATWVNNLPEGHLVQDAVDSATTNLGRLKEGLKFTGIAVGIFSTNKNAGDYVTASIREAELEGYIENLEIYKNYYEQKNRPSCWLSTDRELIVARKLLGFLVGQRKHSCTDMCMGAGFTVAAGVTGYLTGGAGAGATAGANLVYDVGSNAINLRRAAIIEELQAELDKLRQARISECGTFNSNNRSDRRMRDITPLLDPSGIVYEALEASPLEGVTATIWYAADQIGTGAALWDAGSYSQINPQLTGADGAYAWDVSQGWWQVRFTKAGYLDASTPWLQVPPPQMNLTTPMVSTAAPTVTAVHAYPDYIEMVFSQFMDKSAPLTLSGGLTGVWQGDALYAKVLRIPLSGFSLGATVSFTRPGARNYAGVAMADYTNSLPVSPRPAEILLNYDTVVAMKAGEMPNVTVRVKDTEGNYMQGVTVEAFVANTLLAAMDADAVTTRTAQPFSAPPRCLPGLTDLTFSVQGTSLTKTFLCA